MIFPHYLLCFYLQLISPPNCSLDGVLLYRCGGGGRFLEMARNGTFSGAMKLKLTGILNGSEGHL